MTTAPDLLEETFDSRREEISRRRELQAEFSHCFTKCPECKVGSECLLCLGTGLVTRGEMTRRERTTA